MDVYIKIAMQHFNLIKLIILILMIMEVFYNNNYLLCLLGLFYSNDSSIILENNEIYNSNANYGGKKSNNFNINLKEFFI